MMTKPQKKDDSWDAARIVVIAILIMIALLAQPVFAGVIIPPNTLDPRLIPKFVNTLDGPPPVYVYSSTGTDSTTGQTYEYYEVNVSEFYQQILPPCNTPQCAVNPYLPDVNGYSNPPKTKVWGYGGLVNASGDKTGIGTYSRSTPAATFNATKNTAIKVKWTNELTQGHMGVVDPTLHWADPGNCGMIMCPCMPGYQCNTECPCSCICPGGVNDCSCCVGTTCVAPFSCAQSPVPIVPHLHGGEVQSSSDGHPDAWFTSSGEKGTAYNTYEPTDGNAAIFYYPNKQPPATLWYHDHSLGITRINVLSGLAGFYLLRDPGNEPVLVDPKYEMPLVFQDRTFYPDGRLWFDTLGLNPEHPFWTPEYFGNTILVNGMVWPNMNVDQTRYRFRLLDGSNARFYDIDFWDSATGNRIPFFQVGTDGGYLAAPVPLKDLTIAPGERADIVVDFTGVVGPVIMRNRARYPYPKGVTPDPNTDGTIMQFTVNGPVVAPPLLPVTLNTIPVLPTPSITRTRVLWEVMGPLGPLEVLLNGQKWAGSLSETPALGATEDWVIVNPTADTHPIHLHLVQFQLISRQSIDITKYTADWLAKQYTDCPARLRPCGGADPAWRLSMMPPPPWPDEYIPVELPIAPYLKGKPKGPAANEKGWKDTVQMNPGEVTIIRARWSPIDGTVSYPFVATAGPGYVWHCHILDHEDNEMMRPYNVTAAA
jgi:spore coat protein A